MAHLGPRADNSLMAGTTITVPRPPPGGQRPSMSRSPPARNKSTLPWSKDRHGGAGRIGPPPPHDPLGPRGFVPPAFSRRGAA